MPSTIAVAESGQGMFQGECKDSIRKKKRIDMTDLFFLKLRFMVFYL